MRLGSDGSERISLLEGMASETESAESISPGGVDSAVESGLPLVEGDACFRNTTGPDEDDAFTSPGQQILSVLKPVCFTMAIVVFLTHATGEDHVQGGFSGIASVAYQERQADSVVIKAEGVLLNALITMFLMCIATTSMLYLYKFRCYRILYGWLLVSVVSLIFNLGSFVADSLLRSVNATVDAVSFYLFFYNFAAIGGLITLWTELGLGHPPKALKQAYLVLISALLAWSATKLPEWSTWGLLGAVSLWDVAAVLHSKGPLKLIVEEARRREEPIPGLVYEGDSIQLGLGDFVFYSILIGRASLYGCGTLVTCVVAVLAGMMATLVLLPFMQNLLPALPISIVLGIAAYFTSSAIITPLVGRAQTWSFFF